MKVCSLPTKPADFPRRHPRFEGYDYAMRSELTRDQMHGLDAEAEALREKARRLHLWALENQVDPKSEVGMAITRVKLACEGLKRLTRRTP